jgi:hypothetical protein
MDRVDIDHLTEPELVDLNRRVVERLRLIRQLHAHKAMLEFRIGDRVCFDADNRTPITGILTRYNRKSVTVITGDGRHWNVSPQLLRLAKPEANATAVGKTAASKPVLAFKQKNASV